jgi:hypothetical protein
MRIPLLVILGVVLAAHGASAAQAVTLTSRTAIDRSVAVDPGTSGLPASIDRHTTATTIPGAHIGVDVDGAVLNGDRREANPDRSTAWIDVEVLPDTWTPRDSGVEKVTLTGDRRRVKVEYHQTGGFVEIRFDIQRK